MIQYIPFDNYKFDFVKTISDFFDVNYGLKYLHELSKEKYNKLFEVGKDSSTEFHTKFYNQYRSGWPELESLYEKFIREVISIHFDEDFLFQKFPTARFHLPQNVAVGDFHTDAEFGHPDGEINFIIPLTESKDTASVWVESEEGKKDFTSIVLQPGWLVRFNGNRLTHGNKVNATEKTRVSMDFRILPISKYKPEDASSSITTHTKFVEGQYFKRFKKGQ